MITFRCFKVYSDRIVNLYLYLLKGRSCDSLKLESRFCILRNLCNVRYVVALYKKIEIAYQSVSDCHIEQLSVS